MVKKDNAFGEWIATTQITGKATIRQFETGFVISRKDKPDERKDYDKQTNPKDMANEIGQFYFKE